MDLHDYEDVAENYDLYLDAMYRSEDSHAGFREFYLDFAREYGQGGVIDIACGTGAVAVAIVGVETKWMSLPLRVRTSQGYELVVDGDWRQTKGTGFTLTGPVKKVFEGEIDLDSLDIGTEME